MRKYLAKVAAVYSDTGSRKVPCIKEIREASLKGDNGIMTLLRASRLVDAAAESPVTLLLNGEQLAMMCANGFKDKANWSVLGVRVCEEEYVDMS